jgi:hypothetical protein
LNLVLITNKRLLFSGAIRNSNIPLKRVIYFTLYRHRLEIETDSGPDQIYKDESELGWVERIRQGSWQSCGRRLRCAGQRDLRGPADEEVACE